MEKVKTAVIGIGNMGTAHAQSLWDDRVPGLALAAVCDTDPARLAYAAKAWPGVACYASEDALLAAGGVQAAIVAVPHPLHSPGEDGLKELAISNAAYLSQWTGNAAMPLPPDTVLFDKLLAERVKTSAYKPKTDTEHPDGRYSRRWQVNW